MEVLSLNGTLCEARGIVERKGFCIVRNFLPSISTTEAENLKKRVRKSKDIVFQHIEDETVEGDETHNDNKRKQLCLESNAQNFF